MNKKYKIILLVMLALGLLATVIVLIQEASIAVLDPRGSIAAQQRDLMIIAMLLMLIVVIPVFVMVFTFAWKFRASNTRAKYTPNWDHNTQLEAIWWGVPLVIILALSVIIWISSHTLDPYRPLSSPNKPIQIQVVALQWKWLFLYPEYDIATVNYVKFPEQTPIDFQITADSPMNSFWVPQLGGQVYAMAGMSTKLHLIANEPGIYDGVSANISGEGFAGMKFTAQSVSEAEFSAWVAKTRVSSQSLGDKQYELLAQPSKNNPSDEYSSYKLGLYDRIIGKYMTPSQDKNHTRDPGRGVSH